MGSLSRFDSVADFLSEAQGFLVAREAEHNLLLGIAGLLRDHPEVYPEPPYLVVVRQANSVVCVAIRTPPANLVLSDADRLDVVDSIADDLVAQSVDLPGVSGPKEIARHFAAVWANRTGCQPMASMQERITQVIRSAAPPGLARMAEPRDGEMIAAWMTAFHAESLPNERLPADMAAVVDRWIRGVGRRIYLWDIGDRVTSMVGVGSRTPHGARVGPVYTPPPERGRGYASALTAAASQTELDAGSQFCFLFTDLANPTSNHIYQAIGYRPVSDFDMYRFVRQSG
jgi:hypothetical protein